MRRRDERFATQDRHKDVPDPLHDKSAPDAEETPTVYQASDFIYDAEARTCVCPAGKALNRDGHDHVNRDNIWDQFLGKKRDCAACALRALCLRTPATTPVRSVMFFRGKTAPLPETHTARMKQRIDAPEGRMRYGQRFGTVEPVFGNLLLQQRAHPLHAAGPSKVDGQWKLFCLVHNIEKLARAGYAQ